MNLKINLTLFIVLGLLFINSHAKPTPQDDEVQDEDVVEKIDEEEDADPLAAAGDIFGGIFNILNQAVKTATDLATDQELQKTVGDIVDIGVKTSLDAATTAVEIAAEAPKIVEENAPLVEGIAKTVSETSGFVGGQIEEIGTTVEAASQLVKVFAEAYTNRTIEQLDNFLKVFNKRLQCNTTCARMKSGEKKEECEQQFCEGFVPPKTRKQQEEELQELSEQYDYNYDYSEEEDDDEKSDETSSYDDA